MTLNQIVAVAADSTFQNQVKAAAVSYALQHAINAAPTAHGGADDAMWGLAQNTIADGCASILPRFVWAVANSNAGTFTLNDTTDANDAMIAGAIATYWEQIALVNASVAAN